MITNLPFNQNTSYLFPSTFSRSSLTLKAFFKCISGKNVKKIRVGGGKVMELPLKYSLNNSAHEAIGLEEV